MNFFSPLHRCVRQYHHSQALDARILYRAGHSLVEHKKVSLSPSPSRATPSIENLHGVATETSILSFCSVTITSFVNIQRLDLWSVESGVHPVTQGGEGMAPMPIHTTLSVPLRDLGTMGLRKNQLNAPLFSTEDDRSIYLIARVRLCPHKITRSFFPGPLLSQQ